MSFGRFQLVEEPEPEYWPAGTADFIDLWSAPTADALHRVLVLHAPGRGGADAFEPLQLLHKHHEIEPESSWTTALLVLTDRRWQGGVPHLVRRIAESGMLNAEQLDVLAETFLAADDAAHWQVPDHWFAGGPVIELGAVPVGEEEEHEEEPEEEDGADTQAVARRVVFPPLRRWAAAHQLSREPAAWGAMLARAEELSGRGGAAVMAGLLDGIDVLTTEAQTLLVQRASTWPHHSVRRLAFDFIAAHDGVDAAWRLARDDPNARIRVWAATLVEPPPDGQPVDEPMSRSDAEGPGEGGQSTLF